MIVKMGLENKMDQSKFPLPSSEKLQKSFFVQILYVPTFRLSKYRYLVYRVVVRSKGELISSRYRPP